MQTFKTQINDAFIGITTSKAKHINYASYQSRLVTYRNLSHNAIPQAFESLARAGFFYTGSGDLVRCFYCGGGLRSWVRSDDPWTEHQRWFPKCDFLRTFSEQPPTIHQDNLTAIYNSWPRLPLYAKSETNNDTFTPTIKNLDLIIAAKAVLHLGYDRSEVGKAFEICCKDAKSPVTATQLLIKVLELKFVIGYNSHNNGLNACSDALSADNNSMTREELASFDAAEEENSRLKERLFCRICEVKKSEVAFLPCGHMITCLECSPAVRYCLTCNVLVKATVKVFMS